MTETSMLDEMDALTRHLIHTDMVRARTEETLTAELDRMHVMQKIGNLITATFNLEQMLRVVGTSLTREMEFDRVLLYLAMEDSDALVCRTWQGYDAREKENISPYFTQLLRDRATDSDQPQLIAADDADLSGETRDVLKRAGLYAVVIAPVLTRSELIGGIVAGRIKPEPRVTPQEVHYFTLLTNQTGIAIMNSRLYRRIEDYSRNLEREVSERTRELFSAYRELQESKETLVASEKMAFLGQLTAGIAHEINTPIGAASNSLKTVGDLVEELKASIDAPDVTPEDYREIIKEMTEALTVANAAIGKAARFVRSVKAQTRDLANVELRPFDPGQTVEDIVVLLQHELKKNSVNVNVHADRSSGDLTLFGDPGKFSQILTNLINNAIDAYENKGGVIDVRISRHDEEIVHEVEDHGCGISEENMKRLFKQMFTTKWQGKGTGLGLSIVNGLVTGAFGGSIDVQSTVGQGTTFTVRLPRRAP